MKEILTQTVPVSFLTQLLRDCAKVPSKNMGFSPKSDGVKILYIDTSAHTIKLL